MEHLKIKYVNNNYRLVEYPMKPLMALGSFLTTECCEWSTPLFREWANESDSFDAEGNNSWLEKWDNNILIGFLYGSEEDMYKHAFTINKDEFVKVLDKWQELYKQKPNEIHITFENGKITMEGKD